MEMDLVFFFFFKKKKLNNWVWFGTEKDGEWINCSVSKKVEGGNDLEVLECWKCVKCQRLNCQQVVDEEVEKVTNLSFYLPSFRVCECCKGVFVN